MFLSSSPTIKAVEVIKVFSKSIKLELDLRMEASAASGISGKFFKDTDFKVPKVYWDYTSQRVLTIEKSMVVDLTTGKNLKG